MIGVAIEQTEPFLKLIIVEQNFLLLLDKFIALRCDFSGGERPASSEKWNSQIEQESNTPLHIGHTLYVREYIRNVQVIIETYVVEKEWGARPEMGGFDVESFKYPDQ
jgi:hypothetical protein